MKALITTGHSASGIQTIWTLMQAYGVAQAAPAQIETNEPARFHQKLYKAKNIVEADLPGQIKPGRMWQNQAENLLIQNLDSPLWGWAGTHVSRLLEFWSEVDQSIHFVLLYTPPEVAYAMAVGTDLGNADASIDFLSSWRKKNGELLDFYSRNRGRCLLINSYALIARPELLGALLADRFGIETALQEPATKPTLPYPVSALASIIARSKQQDNEAAILFEELETASDLPTQPDYITQDLTRAWQEHTRLAGMEPELINKNADNESLQKKLANQSIALDTANSKIKSAQEKEQAHALENAKLTAELNTLKSVIDQTRKQKEEQGSENELLLLQLHQVQEELEKQYQHAQEIETNLKNKTQALEAKQRDVIKLQDQLHNLEKDRKNSAQELITLKTVLDQTRKQNEEQGSENELLLLQLHQVQEELEKKFLHAQEIEANLNNQTLALETKQRDAIKLQDQLHSLEKDRKNGEQELVNSRKQLQARNIELDQARSEIKSAQEKEQALAQENAKLTTELNTLKTVIDQTRKQNKEQGSENELLLLQLHQVQEELEKYFLLAQKTDTGFKNQTTEPPPASPLTPASSLQFNKLDESDPKVANKPGLMRSYLEKRKSARRLKNHIMLIERSGLFDPQWYLKEHEDVAKSGIDPIKHYLKFGADEGRDPSLNFDTRYYQSSNPDLINSSINPLVHYILHGKEEGRKPHP